MPILKMHIAHRPIEICSNTHRLLLSFVSEANVFCIIERRRFGSIPPQRGYSDMEGDRGLKIFQYITKIALTALPVDRGTRSLSGLAEGSKPTRRCHSCETSDQTFRRKGMYRSSPV